MNFNFFFRNPICLRLQRIWLEMVFNFNVLAAHGASAYLYILCSMLNANVSSQRNKKKKLKLETIFSLVITQSHGLERELSF